MLQIIIIAALIITVIYCFYKMKNISKNKKEGSENSLTGHDWKNLKNDYREF